MLRIESNPKVILVAFAAWLGACRSPDASQDFARARGLIRSSTDVECRFDPADKAAPDPSALEDALRDGLSLQEALTLALANNRELQAGFLEIGVARADLAQAGMLANPSLSLLFLFPSGAGQVDLQAQLAQSVTDLWRIPRRKREAAARLDEAVLRLSRFAGELVADTRDAYFETLGSARVVELAREGTALTGRSLRALQVELEEGVATRLEESLARNESLAAELTLQRAERDEVVARKRLSELLSLDGELQAVLLTDELPEPPVQGWRVEDLAANAARERLDLQAARSALEAARQRLALEDSQWIPALAAGVQREDPENGALLGPGLEVTLPVWDQNQARVARARYELLASERRYEGLVLSATRDVRDAIQRARAAAEAVTLLRETLLPEAERTLALAQQAHAGGDAAWLELLEAQRRALAARKELVAAQLEIAKSLVALERSAGAPLERLAR